jgi:hypothetical protein
MMRFACSKLVVERLDPLVNPGVVGTPHVHQIVGGKRPISRPRGALDLPRGASVSNHIVNSSVGNSFRADMKPVEYDLPTESTCTSCVV